MYKRKHYISNTPEFVELEVFILDDRNYYADITQEYELCGGKSYASLNFKSPKQYPKRCGGGQLPLLCIRTLIWRNLN